MTRKGSLALLGLAVCLGAVPSSTEGFGIKVSSWPGFDEDVDFWPDIDEDLWRSPLGVNLDQWPRFSVLHSDSFLRRPSPNEQRCRWKRAVDRPTEIDDEAKRLRQSAENTGWCAGSEASQRQHQGNFFESESASNEAGDWNPKRCSGEPGENLEYSRRQSENNRKREAEIDRLRNEQRMLKEQEEKYKDELSKLEKKQKDLQEAVKQHRRDEQIERGSRRDRREEAARLRREQEERLRQDELMRMRQEEEARQRHDEALQRQRREEEARLERDRHQSRLRREEEERARREELVRQQDRLRREQELEKQRRRHEEWVRQERQRREEEHEKSRRNARQQEEQRRNEERLAQIQRQLNEWETLTRRPSDGATHDFHTEPQKRSDLFTLDIPKDYYPDELNIKTEGHNLKVKGTQFCRCEDGCVYKEFERSLSLPRTIGTENLSATLDSHGRLRINGYRYSQEVTPSDRTVSVRGLGIPNSSGRTQCAKPQRGVGIKTTRNTLRRPKAYEFDEVTGTYDAIDDDGVTVEDELQTGNY